MEVWTSQHIHPTLRTSSLAKPSSEIKESEMERGKEKMSGRNREKQLARDEDGEGDRQKDRNRKSCAGSTEEGGREWGVNVAMNWKPVCFIS